MAINVELLNSFDWNALLNQPTANNYEDVAVFIHKILGVTAVPVVLTADPTESFYKLEYKGFFLCHVEARNEDEAFLCMVHKMYYGNYAQNLEAAMRLPLFHDNAMFNAVFDNNGQPSLEIILTGDTPQGWAWFPKSGVNASATALAMGTWLTYVTDVKNGAKDAK